MDTANRSVGSLTVLAFRELLREELETTLCAHKRGTGLDVDHFTPTSSNQGISSTPRTARAANSKSGAAWLGDTNRKCVIIATEDKGVAEEVEPELVLEKDDGKLLPGGSPLSSAQTDVRRGLKTDTNGHLKKSDSSASLSARCIHRETEELKEHRRQEVAEFDSGMVAAAAHCFIRYAEENKFSNVAKLRNLHDAWVKHLKVAQRTARLDSQIARFVTGYAFKLAVTCAILANSVFIFEDTNRLVEEASTGDEGDRDMYVIAEQAFLIFYTVELVLKLYVFRLAFFCNEDMNWNVLDLFLVASGWLTWLLEYVVTNTVFLRLVRMLKIIKVLRSFRLMQQLESLRVLLDCLLGTLWELLWSIVMLVIVFFMFATVIMQLVASHVERVNDNNNFQETEGVQAILARFGSEWKSILTLFKACTGGDDWSVYYDLAHETGELGGALFLFFVCFTQIAFLNIVTGLFIERALEHAKPDIRQRAANHRFEKAQLREELTELVNEINYKGDNITEEEFVKTITGNVELRSTLEVMGLDLMDHAAFFRLVLLMQGQPVQVDLFDVPWHHSWKTNLQHLCQKHKLVSSLGRTVRGQNGSEFKLELSDELPQLEPLPEEADFPLTVSRSGDITVDHFIAGCLKLKGNASSREMHGLGHKVDLMIMEQAKQQRMVSELMSHLLPGRDHGARISSYDI